MCERERGAGILGSAGLGKLALVVGRGGDSGWRPPTSRKLEQAMPSERERKAESHMDI
jgi:hypothetical protein